MRILALVLSAWLAWRWLGFAIGIVRVKGFERGPVRSEARRTVIGRAALNIFLSVIVLLLWASALGTQPGARLVGFLAAAVMCSLAVGIAIAFMQPEERTPSTLDVCRVRRGRSPPERVDDRHDGGTDDHDHEGREDAQQ